MRRPKIAIIDYGIGNLRSIANALREVDADAEIEADPTRLHNFDGVILPGVGAFQPALEALMKTRMADSLDFQRQLGKPILGICLGMQLMCESSSENGIHKGLGWFNASVGPLPPGKVKVPHVGWNNLTIVREHPLLADLPESPDLYFVHSYRVQVSESLEVLAVCHYDEPFCAVFAKDNIQGVQFHPEKSQQAGLKILANFVGSV